MIVGTPKFFVNISKLKQQNTRQNPRRATGAAVSRTSRV
jgi:hypothetical protein